MITENERLENRVRRREYYKRHHEKPIAVQMEYYHRHREEILEKNKARFRKRMEEETPEHRKKRLEMERVLRKLNKWGKSKACRPAKN